MTMTTVVDGKHMRIGYTTGTCVVAAAQAAIAALETGEVVESVRVRVPAGDVLTIEVSEIRRTADRASYSVIKDSGDDPDVTDGIEMRVTIERTESGRIEWRKGVGVGTYTEGSLFGKTGMLAINPVPKREITALLKKHLGEGIAIQIDIPKGEEVAKKTFNPRIGIRGGLSILGTTGLVKPMSKDAYVATIDMELRAIRRKGSELIYLTPGNYGERYVSSAYGGGDIVKVSNYFGDALRLACDYGFKRIVVLGHIGKMAKLAIGIFQTHSAVADGRMESIAYYLAKAGAPLSLIESVEGELTAEGAIKRCTDGGYGGILRDMEKGIVARIKKYVKSEDVKIDAVIYTMEDVS
ncbi:MAG: cobalt-precorrin-5B (C(1))-methyltransferase CbiD [Peptoniphilus sp.]|nr:cobalt-precorrin-5B (C(1))-methyltransferase CbiD [Peptoniphilus sp.]MDD7363717.1 cobalt-precorrin-5B (C(1))-methyltransferase CbiD [Bacillota bacterium]MDY6044102.1 cobalt-precorrin-5B (C(1))-methyltransferase CbiD [Peptoniphilus sp.]